MPTYLPVIQPGDQLSLFKDPNELPTGKCHVSFSEVNTIIECGWKHKLTYVQGLRDGDSEHTTYGRAIHSGLEDWLLHGHEAGFEWDERINECHNEVLQAFETLKFTPKGGETELTNEWLDPIDYILREVPAWLDGEFPGWKLFAAEPQLFEPIEGLRGKYFKGFIDCVIRVPKVARKGSKKPAEGFIYWILDWKTTSWGWDAAKKQDKYKRMQLALYKHYFAEKLGIPLEDIKCGFVLLKRVVKKNASRVELIEVSVGDKTRKDALDLVSSSVNLIAKRLFLKNRNSCRFCQFKFTPECP